MNELYLYTNAASVAKDLSSKNSDEPGFCRRSMLKTLAGLGIGTLAFQRALTANFQAGGTVTAELIRGAEWIADIELDDEQREQVARALQSTVVAGKQLRAVPVDVDTVPALVFRPDFFYAQAHEEIDNSTRSEPLQLQVHWSVETDMRRADLADEDLAFASLSEQASLLASGQLSSRELTRIYLNRLEKFDPILHCVVELLGEHALESAAASDLRRKHGATRGVLDGIPWVAKDLIAVAPWKTTWGAEPFREQVRTSTATVARKLSDAGAVLLAKVSLGALAWGDVWFGGTTRNPWNPEQGSSGSSAGSAAAVAAGLATFALGSETLGSIVSPTRRCRTSGLRPTFGRVSRAGCMPLAWSMDKIGPIARYVDDLALVFPQLLGTDGLDPTLVERSYRWPDQRHAELAAGNLQGIRVGLTGDRLSAMETSALQFFQSAGATIIDLNLKSEFPVEAMNFVLGTEAASVFEDAFRQTPDANYGLWSGTFRQAPFTPAMQYLRANRIRGQLITEAERTLGQVDVVLGGNDLLLTNLTGHPSLVVACGVEQVDESERPGVVKLTAKAYAESTLLMVGKILQEALPVTIRPGGMN
ncbi:MAG: amidase [Pirellulaceae bacterium]